MHASDAAYSIRKLRAGKSLYPVIRVLFAGSIWMGSLSYLREVANMWTKVLAYSAIVLFLV